MTRLSLSLLDDGVGVGDDGDDNSDDNIDLFLNLPDNDETLG